MLTFGKLWVGVMVAVLSISHANRQLELMQLYYYTLKHGSPPPVPEGPTMEEVIPLDPDEVYVAPKQPIPRDEDDRRYVKSFTVKQKAEYAKFYEEYGFVVIRDVLSENECHRTLDDLWSYIEQRQFEMQHWLPKDVVSAVQTYAASEMITQALTKPAIRRNDLTTWNNGWPPLESGGFLGYVPVFLPQVIRNRQNSKVYSVFSTLMGRKDLMVSHDRLGMFRPMLHANGKETHKNWSTQYSLHWDLNPWRHTLNDPVFVQGTRAAQKSVDSLTYVDLGEFFHENNEIGTEGDGQVNTQGLLNLADNLEEDGGFHLVVGFHKHLRQWAESTKNIISRYFMDKNFIPVHKHDPLYKQPQRVSMRAGSLIVWDQRVAHGSQPNHSTRPRYSQFVKMFPAIKLDSQRAKFRAQLLREKVDLAGVKLTELGKKLFALKEWT